MKTMLFLKQSTPHERMKTIVFFRLSTPGGGFGEALIADAPTLLAGRRRIAHHLECGCSLAGGLTYRPAEAAGTPASSVTIRR